MKKIPKVFFYFLICSVAFFSCSQDSEDAAYMKNSYSYDYVQESDGNYPGYDGENYEEYADNPFINVNEAPVSTFSIDADGGSYTNVRRFIESGSLPQKGAVRIEELINYFKMDYAEPAGQHPVAVNGEIAACPWTAGNKLIRVGIKGKTYEKHELPNSNIVLLIDVSGSMDYSDKLPLLQDCFCLLVDELRDNDRVAIVTYAGSSGVALESTPGSEKNKIKNVINGLSAGGSTAGADGINTAYEIAGKHFVEGGNNRVILATDGDFNVGISSTEELVDLIENKREEGVFLTTIGVGTGNYNDHMLEQLADNGNGTYEYFDSYDAAEKYFVEEFGKVFCVAKDVKVQVEFNPAWVSEYRLIGYENRVLDEEDFEDDEKDAGEIGSGQTITAMYEIVPAQPGRKIAADKVFVIDFRYKQPDGTTSTPIALGINDLQIPFEAASENMRFAASVAAYGMLLRESQYKGNVTYDHVIAWAGNATSFDPEGHRQDFVDLVSKAKALL